VASFTHTTFETGFLHSLPPHVLGQHFVVKSTVQSASETQLLRQSFVGTIATVGHCPSLTTGATFKIGLQLVPQESEQHL
jgi:hypothetical protein